MSNIQTGAERMPHDLSHLGFLAGQIGRLITISTTPVIAGDSFERSEERFSRNAETDLVCRLLLEKKNLDVTIQVQILEIMKTIKRTFGTSILLITHNLGVLAMM